MERVLSFSSEAQASVTSKANPNSAKSFGKGPARRFEPNPVVVDLGELHRMKRKVNPKPWRDPRAIVKGTRGTTSASGPVSSIGSPQATKVRPVRPCFEAKLCEGRRSVPRRSTVINSPVSLLEATLKASSPRERPTSKKGRNSFSMHS